MPTTIQVNEKTLLLLKKLKEQLVASSYDEAIIKLAGQRTKGVSLAGSLKKYLRKGEKTEDILEQLQKERRESDRA
jgi:hypothetical protein